MSLVHWRYLVLCGALVVASCGTKSSDKQAVDAKVASAVATAGPIGTVESVEVTTTGSGISREDAIRDAAIRAIEEVHGRAIAISTVSKELGSVAIVSSSSTGSSRSSANASATVTAGGRRLSDASAGIITALKIEHEAQLSGTWTVTVRASVAKYSPPGGNRTRLVVAPIKAESGTATLAQLNTIRNGIADALTATGRVAVLDRSSSEIDAELDFTASGNARATEGLKRSQADVADFVVVTQLDDFRVERHARSMRTTNREIVSYAGHAAISFKVIHLASRQILASGSFETSKSSEESLREQVDTITWKSDMLRDLQAKVSERVVSLLIPIVVVSQNGAEVTLNAGTPRVRESAVYSVVILGDALMDPQSKQSIGRQERQCCKLSVTSVSDHSSTGHLSEVPVLKVGESLEIRALVHTP